MFQLLLLMTMLKTGLVYFLINLFQLLVFILLYQVLLVIQVQFSQMDRKVAVRRFQMLFERHEVTSTGTDEIRHDSETKASMNHLVDVLTGWGVGMVAFRFARWWTVTG